MFLVSIAVFLITESSPGNVAKNVLGAFIKDVGQVHWKTVYGI